MKYNYMKMLGRMAELGISKEKLSKEIGIGRTSLYKKLKSETEFTQDEIKACVKILNLSDEDIPTYFFTAKV